MGLHHLIIVKRVLSVFGSESPSLSPHPPTKDVVSRDDNLRPPETGNDILGW